MSSQDTLLTESPPSRSRRLPLLIVVGVVAVAVVALAVMLLPGSADDVPAPLTVTATPVATDDEQDGQDIEDDLVGSSVPVTTYEVFLSRDPFERVVPEEVQQTSTTPDGTNTDGSSGNDSNSGDGTNSGDDADGSSSDGSDTNGDSSTPIDQDGPACVGQQELVCDGQVVTLIDVTDQAGEPVAVIQVDTTVYEVRRGQTFASNFEVRAIDGSCVSLLYGDDGFQLCRGDTVLK